MSFEIVVGAAMVGGVGAAIGAFVLSGRDIDETDRHTPPQDNAARGKADRR